MASAAVFVFITKLEDTDQCSFLMSVIVTLVTDREVSLYRLNQEKLTRLVGHGIKDKRPMFKTKRVIHHSKANLGPVYMRSDPNESVPKL